MRLLASDVVAAGGGVPRPVDRQAAPDRARLVDAGADDPRTVPTHGLCR